jgi:hypothetical protein
MIGLTLALVSTPTVSTFGRVALCQPAGTLSAVVLLVSAV